MVFADEWHVGQVFFSMLWFFLFFIWIWLLIMVFADIFRDHKMSGWAKAAWIIFVVIVPVPRRVRVPDRAWRFDGTSAPRRSSSRPTSSSSSTCSRSRPQRQRRRSARPTSWRGSPTSRARA